MLCWNACTKSSDICYAYLKLIWPNNIPPQDVDVFLDNTTWAIFSTYHAVLEASPGAAILGQDMLFDILLVVDWNEIGEYRQSLTDHSNQCENS
jgi:hypothetical protein